MTFDIRKEAALRIAGEVKEADLYPAPFPSGLPCSELENVSLSMLLNGDEEEAAKVFKACQSTGFFELDMLDHPTGRALWREACAVQRIGRNCFETVSTEEKLKYKPWDGLGVSDRGYMRFTTGDSDADQRELFNVPQSEFFGTRQQDQGIPKWLEADQEKFKVMFAHGNVIANAILGVLEKGLGLPASTLTRLHRLSDDSADAVRVLRYPASEAGGSSQGQGLVAHRDAVSVSILFTWLGGLQLVKPGAEFEGLAVKEEDWLWAQPTPGCAIVNLGDAMEVFTGKVLKSGVHRVIRAPGQQGSFARHSVLLTTRPENSTPMKAFESPVIPKADTAPEKVLTSLEWGHKIVQEIRRRLQEGQKQK